MRERPLQCVVGMRRAVDTDDDVEMIAPCRHVVRDQRDGNSRMSRAVGADGPDRHVHATAPASGPDHEQLRCSGRLHQTGAGAMLDHHGRVNDGWRERFQEGPHAQHCCMHKAPPIC